ncbi:MAG TPA: hypothetical protein VG054_01090, partial [Acidimicrobiales bacterium]|nr:hypothetical protein [Acidimicrobiales bacterium]
MNAASDARFRRLPRPFLVADSLAATSACPSGGLSQAVPSGIGSIAVCQTGVPGPGGGGGGGPVGGAPVGGGCAKGAVTGGGGGADAVVTGGGGGADAAVTG